MLIFCLGLAEAERSYCISSGPCCSVVITGSFHTSLLSGQSVSVMQQYAEPFTTYPNILVSHSYLQFSQPSSSRSLSLRLQKLTSFSQILLQNLQMLAPLSHMLQFSYLATIANYFTLFQTVYTDTLTNSAGYFTHIPSSNPWESSKCSCFLLQFVISNTSSSNFLGLLIFMTLDNSKPFPLFNIQNSFLNTLNLVKSNCAFFDILKMQNNYDTNSGAYLTAVKYKAFPFQLSNSDSYSELSNQHNSFIPDTTLLGIQGFFHNTANSTFSLGLALNAVNQVIASISKNGYPLNSGSIGTVYLSYSVFAIYQYSCTNNQTLSPNRTICLSHCPASYYNNTCGRCMPCHFTCLTCEGGDDYYSCTSCSNQLHRTVRLGQKGPCQCTVGFVGRIKQNTVCLPCHPLCLQCLVSNHQNQCLSCANPAMELINFTCLCTKYFINISSVCHPCASQCLTCLGSVNLCTSCKENDNFVQSIVTGQTTCITCGLNQQFNQFLQACLCAKNYTLVNGTCSFYGLGLDFKELQLFENQLKAAKHIARTQNVLFKSLIVLGLNSALLNLICDSQLLRIHLLSNLTNHKYLVLALMMLDTGDSPLEQWRKKYQAIISPAVLFIQAQSLPYFKIQFPVGRYFLMNLFDQLVNATVVAAGLLGLLVLKAMLQLLLKCSKCKSKLKSAKSVVKKNISQWPLRLFVVYYQSSLDIAAKALAQITMAPAAPTPFLSVNLFLSFLSLPLYLTIIVSLQILYLNFQTDTAYLIIFRPSIKNFGVTHSLCHLLISLKPVLVAMVLYLTPGAVTSLLLLIACNLTSSVMLYYVRKAVKDYTLQQARHLLLALFQCLLLAMHFLTSYQEVWNYLAYSAIALMLAIVICGFSVLVLFILDTIKKVASVKRRHKNRSEKSLRFLKSRRAIRSLMHKPKQQSNLMNQERQNQNKKY